MNKLDNFVFGQPASNDPSFKDLETNLDKYFTNLRRILNNGLDFTDNFNCTVVTLTTNATPGVVTVITHNLKRVPVGCLVLERNKAGHIFTTAKNAAGYSIASDVASLTVTLVIL